MSIENVRVAQAAYEALIVGDLNALGNQFAEDIEWETPDSLPLGGLYRCRDEVLANFAQIPQYWSEFIVEPDQCDFYARQLKDWKGSAEIEQLVPKGLAVYGRLCGWALARAHASSGDSVAIAAYLGKGTSFDRAIVEFSHAHAEQNERDYKALAKAVKSARITAEEGR
jgi:hypothetical protein